MSLPPYASAPTAIGSVIPGGTSGGVAVIDGNNTLQEAPYTYSGSAGNIPSLDLARTSLVQILDALGATNVAQYAYQDAVTPTSTFYNSLSIANFGSPVGQPNPFNRVEADIVSSSTSNPITEGRCVVRSTGPTGTILAVATTKIDMLASTVGPTHNYTSTTTPYRVIFDFGAQIVPAGNLWVEMHFNGVVFMREGTYTYTVAGGYPEAVYSGFGNGYIYQDPTSNYMANNLGLINVWYRFSNSDCSYAYESGYAGTITEAASTFTGWGGPIGAPTQFNRVEFDICPWDLTSIPQNGRVRLFVNNQSGTLLADKEIAITIPNYILANGTSITTGGQALSAYSYRVVVDLDTVINNSAGNTIWIDFQFDGHVGVRELTAIKYPTSGGYTGLYYTTTAYAIGTTLPATALPQNTASWSLSGVQFNVYCKCSLVALNPRRIRSKGEATTLLKNFIAQAVAPDILLPATMYAIVGHEFTIYFDNVIAPPEGMHAQYPSPLYEYVVLSNFNEGTQYSERYSYTPTIAEIGTTSITLQVYYQGILVNSATCSIVVRAQTAASPVTRKIVTIGDSFLKFGSMLAELYNLSNVNNSSPGLIVSLTSSSTTATATTFAPHGLTNGTSVTIGGVVSTNGYYNGTYTITSTGDNTFTYTLTGADSTPAVALANVTSSNTMAIATTQGPHGFYTGQSVVIAGVPSVNSHYNGTFTITVLGLNTFSYTIGGTDTPNGQLSNYIYFKTTADNLTLTFLSGSSTSANSSPDAQGTYRSVASDAVSGSTVAYNCYNSASNFANTQTITSGGTQGTNTVVLASVAEIVAGTWVQLTGGTAEVLQVSGVNTGTKTVTFYTNIANTSHTSANWFAFANYLTTNSLTMSSNDWVFLQLGTNDVFSCVSDAAVYAVIATAFLQLKSMIANIQAAVSGVRIALGMIHPPCRQQEPFGINYAASSSTSNSIGSRYRRSREMWLQALYNTWQNSTASKIWVVPVGKGLDTINNMITESNYYPNQYNGNLQTVQSNALHAATIGFYQDANALWEFLRGQES